MFEQTNFLTNEQVRKDLGVSRTWLYLAEKEGRYPKGIRLTARCVRYRADLHQQFINGEWRA
ncbi:AlpA family phage regulatory protein [Aliagarivorans taiwanensis]|uniref:helix-turn-helix transcriptional regulator n=1 Tax=Aliagarivorans taiwanensis TaxID=561966 RepID=UPI000411899B